MRPALVPDSSTNTGAQKCVIQRVSASGNDTFASPIGSIDIAGMKEIPRVVDGHDDDDQPTQHVDGAQAVAAMIGNGIHDAVTLGRFVFRRGY